MHRIDGPAAAPGNLFTEGDIGAGTPATVVTDDWLNAVQEELATVVVTGGGIALSKPNNAQLLAAIRAMIAAAVPPGQVAPFARSTAPAGWLECNGTAVSRTAYAALFSAVGTVFGVGDGSTTFNLPDLRGEFVRGWDHGRGVDETVGRAFGSAQASANLAHTHNLAVYSRTVDGTDEEGDNTVATTGTMTGGYVASSGGAEARPRNVALLFCVKT